MEGQLAHEIYQTFGVLGLKFLDQNLEELVFYIFSTHLSYIPVKFCILKCSKRKPFCKKGV